MKKLSLFVIYGLAVSLVLTVHGSAVAAPQGQVPPGLRTSGPVSCDGSDSLLIRDRYISTDGNGVEAKGKCSVVIVNCHIDAGGVGVLAAGTSEVKVRDSFVSGKRAGLVAENRGVIRFRSSTIRGGTKTRNLGEIIDEGGSETAAQADPHVDIGQISVQTGPGGVRISTGDDTVVVGDDSMETGGVRVTPEGVITEDSAVQVGPEGVQVTTAGETVLVGDGFVRITEGGRVTEISGDWRTIDSRYSESDTERILIELGATEDEGTLHIRMSGDVLFDFDSDAIRRDAAQELAKVAYLVRARSAGTVYVIGHTDSIGEESYNQKLSEARAVAVMHWLNRQENIPVGVMAGQGSGEKQPIAHNTMPDGSDNPEGRARNRRVEINFDVVDR